MHGVPSSAPHFMRAQKLSSIPSTQAYNVLWSLLIHHCRCTTHIINEKKYICQSHLDHSHRWLLNIFQLPTAGLGSQALLTVFQSEGGGVHSLWTPSVVFCSSLLSRFFLSEWTWNHEMLTLLDLSCVLKFWVSLGHYLNQELPVLNLIVSVPSL